MRFGWKPTRSSDQVQPLAPHRSNLSFSAMKLSLRNDYSFKLTLIGYEFPLLKDVEYDSNWLNIRIDVRHPMATGPQWIQRYSLTRYRRSRIGFDIRREPRT